MTGHRTRWFSDYIPEYGYFGALPKKQAKQDDEQTQDVTLNATCLLSLSSQLLALITSCLMLTMDQD